jgi:uncharacterized hydrophobic protein (TIGR00271 family)
VSEEPPNTETEAPAPKPRLITRARALLRWTRRILFQNLPAEEAREVRQSVAAEGRFSERYALMCALSAGIATLGLLQSSAAVVIGAMLVSPLMGPIAALGFGFASVDGRRIRDASEVVGAGALIGIGVGMLITLLSPIRNATPEIIARTAPTLLDLGVAVLSGLAGGYATVHKKGETAIGVAIATALMPPLAALGYSIAVLRFDFAWGAFLLFLTTWAAMSFSFAGVARLRGVARPFLSVEFKPQFVVLGALAFLVLATPLALTLRRITQESFLSNTVRREVVRELDIEPSQIAQMSVSSPLLERARIVVTAVTPAYRAEAEAQLVARLSQMLGQEPEFTLRQIVAADTRAQTQAMIDAALARASETTTTTVGIGEARNTAQLPIVAAWLEERSDTIALAAAPMQGLTLADYRAEEVRLNALFPDRRIIIVPPFREATYVAFTPDEDTPPSALGDTVWAMQRWGIRQVTLTVSGDAPVDAATALLEQSSIPFVQSPAAPTDADLALVNCGRECSYGVLLRVTRRAPTPLPSSPAPAGPVTAAP